METLVGYVAVNCDATGCLSEATRRFDTRLGGSSLSAEKALFAQLAAEGWTFWASRSRRAYCPYHGPKPGHGMYELTQSFAKGATNV
jgi:hypothetical protein